MAIKVYVHPLWYIVLTVSFCVALCGLLLAPPTPFVALTDSLSAETSLVVANAVLALISVVLTFVVYHLWLAAPITRYSHPYLLVILTAVLLFISR